MDENYIEEKQLQDNNSSIPIKALAILIPKAQENVCKIYCSDESRGTGFFCKIPYDFNITMKVLMTNYHVLKEEDILMGKHIKFSINDEKQFYDILIDKSRKLYANKGYDITIIELKKYDKLDGISYFDLDERIFEKNFSEIFHNEQIYLLHYPKGKQMEYSIGIIRGINENDYTIRHSCDSREGSSGAPIINTFGYHVLGIHKGGAEGNKNYNLGTLLKGAIEEFKNDVNQNEINDEIDKNEDIDEITIQYKINDINDNDNEYSKNIRIFGNEFVENNKDKCKIIINGNEHDLSTHLNINKKQLNNDILEIKIRGIKQIRNLNSMFKGEFEDNVPLLNLPDISNWNTKYITNLSCMFSDCSSLLTLPDILLWDTRNVIDMSYMFYGCSSLSNLPDISLWNTKKVINMSGIFYGCSSLSNLPDISIWNTQNVTNMSYMFYDCSSLSALPDISKWNTQNVTNMSYMFRGCSKLTTFPEILKWNTKKVTNMSYMFKGCSSLSTLPDISISNIQNAIKMNDNFEIKKSLSLDISKLNTQNGGNLNDMLGIRKSFSNLLELPKWISQNIINKTGDDSLFENLSDIKKWNTQNITDMSFMFSDCSSLLSLPDISLWDTKNVTNMNGMFKGCKSLSSLPDISKWNTQNVIDMNSMFYDCSSLSNLPDISIWNTQNVNDMSYMFKGCSSLTTFPNISICNTKNVTGMFEGTNFENYKQSKGNECYIF